MSFLPSLLRQNSRPYEKQISSAKKHEKIRRENSSSVLDKPIVKTKTRIKQCSGVEKTARSSEYDEMSFMQRVDLALESYGNVIDENPDIASCVKRTKTTIKHIADKFGLEWKALKQHIGYASRDHLFFDNFSMEYYIDHMEGLIARQPLRFLLLSSAVGQQTPWGAPSYAEDMDSSDSGGLSEQFIREQCGENTCTLESNTFISLSSPGTKRFLIKKANEIASRSNDNEGSQSMSPAPSSVSLSLGALSSLCSVYVMLHEKNIPPTVLFSKVMKNKKANVHLCPFAFVLFDKYIIMKFPNYFHLMCGSLKDPMEVLYLVMFMLFPLTYRLVFCTF
mmetsp:Transcript_4388/g.8146  ORF Transcript_4388/g.8146 Transcript_4388/m.8146 type:complete len:336 (-) Transcript_4388:435-1442(-)